MKWEGCKKSLEQNTICAMLLLLFCELQKKTAPLLTEATALSSNSWMRGEERGKKNTYCPHFREVPLSAAISKKVAEVTALLPPCPAGSATCLEAASNTTGRAGFVFDTVGQWPYTQDYRTLLSSQVMMGQFIFIGISREGQPVWSTLQQ